MKIEDIRQMYQQGNIDTKEYAARMFEKYEELFAYKELLKQSKVKEISINEQEVLFKIRFCRLEIMSRKNWIW